MRIKLDLILDAVIAKRREVTFDCDEITRDIG